MTPATTILILQFPLPALWLARRLIGAFLYAAAAWELPWRPTRLSASEPRSVTITFRHDRAWRTTTCTYFASEAAPRVLPSRGSARKTSSALGSAGQTGIVAGWPRLLNSNTA